MNDVMFFQKKAFSESDKHSQNERKYGVKHFAQLGGLHYFCVDLKYNINEEE